MSKLRMARTVVVAMAAVAVIGTLGHAAVYKNPERKWLERQINVLDTQLVQKKAIARDLERYKTEVLKLRERLATVRRTFLSDIDRLRVALSEHRVTVDDAPPAGGGFYSRREIELIGEGQGTLFGTMATIGSSGLLLRPSRVEISEAGRWKAKATGFVWNGAPAPPPLVPPPRWYSRFNDDLRAEIEAKKKELESLDKVIGDVADFTKTKSEVEDLLVIVPQLKKGADGEWPLVQALFLGSGRVFSSGFVEIAHGGAGAKARGELADGVAPERIRAMLGERFEVSNIAIKGGEATLTLLPAEPDEGEDPGER